jgi:heme exporter protein B
MPMSNSIFLALIKRDLTICWRNRSELLNPLVFFVIVISLFPLGVSPEPTTLSLIAPGILWVAALLVTLLSLDSLYRSDYDDGSLEQLLISGHSLVEVIQAKVLVHWLAAGLPLTLLSPVLGLMLHMPLDSLHVVFLSMLVGTPILCLLGAVIMALTLMVKKGGLLTSILLLPLYTPILIFASAAVNAANLGLNWVPQLLVLAGALLISVVLAPLAAGAALKISIN